MKSLKGLKVGLCVLVAIGFVFVSIPPADATPAEQMEMFHKAAKAEGEVIWQTSGSVKAVEPASDVFRKRFPDIKITVVSIGASAIGTRLIAEAGAKRISVDVGSDLLSYVMPVMDRDLLVQYDWVKNMGVNPELVSYDNRFVTYGHSPRVWIYNTNLVSKAEVPKSLEDVLAPKWKGGKIVVRAAPSGFAWLWPRWKEDKEKVIAFLKGFVKQDVIPGKRDAMVTNQIATGEVPIGTVSAHNAYRALEKGAPIAVINMGPTASDPQMFFIPKGAPHPNAAKLLLAWLSSKEGMKGVVDSGYGLAYPPDASPMAKLLADNGIGFVSIQSREDAKEYEGVFADTVMKLMNFVPK